MFQQAKQEVCIALDGAGGDSKDTSIVVEAVRFAFAMYPVISLIIYGSAQLEQDLAKANIDKKRYTFRLAQQAIPQDTPPDEVLKNYQKSAMYQALLAVKNGEALAMLSNGGSGPLVSLARHILGVFHLNNDYLRVKTKFALKQHKIPKQFKEQQLKRAQQVPKIQAPHEESLSLSNISSKQCSLMNYSLRSKVRPCFAAKIPVALDRFALMLDLGANASCSVEDLYDFAILGNACAKYHLAIDNPRIAILNVGTEQGKGNALVQETQKLMQSASSLYYTGFIEANRLFCDEADIILCDGFTGNIVLKAAEGVANLYANGTGVKKIFAKMARPDYLLPWQYNGSLLLGVNGIVVKSHANAGKEALAVAMVEAYKAASIDLANKLKTSIQ